MSCAPGSAPGIEANRSSAIVPVASCPVCGAMRARSTPYRWDPFAVVRCDQCRLWYLSPRVAEEAMRASYREDGYYEGSASGYEDYATQEHSLRMTFRRLLDRLQRRGLTGGALLEVGCGFGYFLAEAAPYFDERVGTEMSPAAASRAEARADQIVCGDVADVEPAKRFDCIVALQVVEHVYEPIPFVRELAARLRPGGAVVLSTPDMASLWRRVLGRSWPSFKVPEHVVFYDDTTLPDLLRRGGLEGLARIPHPHAFPLGEVLGKLGLRRLAAVRSPALWIPGTTIAWAGRLPEDGRGAR